ncbi:MAG: transposase, partial [Candidatus Omnitrophota bacterium]
MNHGDAVDREIIGCFTSGTAGAPAKTKHAGKNKKLISKIIKAAFSTKYPFVLILPPQVSSCSKYTPTNKKNKIPPPANTLKTGTVLILSVDPSPFLASDPSPYSVLFYFFASFCHKTVSLLMEVSIMPRTKRFLSDAVIYHIISRGSNRKNVFVDENDFSKYLQLAWKYKNKFSVKIYAYCLMSNHVHLLV